MKSRFINAGIGTFLGMIIFIGLGHTESFGQRAGNQGTIEGTWRNQVTVTDCQGNVLASFPGLLSYHAGGTMSETGGTSPSLRSPGHGIWEIRGDRSYGGKFTYFTFDAAGNHTGRFEVNQNLVLSRNGSELNDTATANIFDADDNLLVQVCATAEARRID